jgi:hypothetical protein
LSLLDEEVALLKDSLGGLPRAVEADAILRAIWLDDVHNSTGIEGNTMTKAQVVDLVERGRASASLLESLEVEGYAHAADWVYRVAADREGVPVSIVSEVHKRTVRLAWELEPPVTRDQPGAWRQAPVAVRAVRYRYRQPFPRTSTPGVSPAVSGEIGTRSSTPPFITRGSSGFTRSLTGTAALVACSSISCSCSTGTRRP